jgi:hypothetical protein
MALAAATGNRRDRGFNELPQSAPFALAGKFQASPDHFDAALGLMYDRKLQAIKLMNIPLDANTNATPCYEYAVA